MKVKISIIKDTKIVHNGWEDITLVGSYCKQGVCIRVFEEWDELSIISLYEYRSYDLYVPLIVDHVIKDKFHYEVLEYVIDSRYQVKSIECFDDYMVFEGRYKINYESFKGQLDIIYGGFRSKALKGIISRIKP